MSGRKRSKQSNDDDPNQLKLQKFFTAKTSSLTDASTDAATASLTINVDSDIVNCVESESADSAVVYTDNLEPAYNTGHYPANVDSTAVEPVVTRVIPQNADTEHFLQHPVGIVDETEDVVPACNLLQNVEESEASASVLTLPMSSDLPRSDVGFTIQKVLARHQVTDEELRQCLENRWIPHSKDDFPYSVAQKTRRYLGSHYLAVYPWLAVSRVTSLEGAWCVWCALFHSSKKAGGSGNSGGQALGALVQKPLTRFHKLSGKEGELSHHNNTHYHMWCKERVFEFQNRSKSGSKQDIRNLQNRARQQAIENNRKTLVPIIETVLLCARQNIPLRGHRDSGRILSDEHPDVNEGNFRALLRYRVRSGDENLRKHLFEGPGNAQYISPDVQNGLLDASLDCLQANISESVNNATCWSLLCDETTDRMKREQLCVTVRYISTVNGEVRLNEDPICLIDAVTSIAESSGNTVVNDVRLTGHNLGNIIISKCRTLNLNMTKCVGQGMDGAANMSSEVKGAAAVVRREAPMALYFHCMMHCFNLCASQSVNVISIRNCLDLVREIISFFSFSASRNYILQQTITEVHTENLHLKKLCDTRFVEKHSSVLTILRLIPSLHLTFERLSTSDTTSCETRSQAARLLSSIEKFQFLISLQTLAETSGLLIGVSRSLQNVGSDIIKALDDVQTVKDVLLSMRQDSEASFQKIYDAAENLAKDMNVQVDKPRVARRSVYRAGAGASTDDESVFSYFRINLYVPLLDGLCSHLDDRFSSTQQKALSLMGLVPAFISDDVNTLQPAIDLYAALLPSAYEIYSEFIIWKHRWQHRPEEAARVRTAAAALQEVCKCETLPNVKVLLQILVTLPVTTAEPERVFSKVERTATAVRNMNEARLEALVLLQAHLDKTPRTEDVLNKFATVEARRLKLVL